MARAHSLVALPHEKKGTYRIRVHAPPSLPISAHHSPRGANRVTRRPHRLLFTGLQIYQYGFFAASKGYGSDCKGKTHPASVNYDT